MLQTQVRREQIVERVVGKGDMLETSAHTIVISKMGIVEHRQPMVLVVVGQKGEKRAFVPRFSAEHRRPPLHYLLKASRAQDDVGQFAGTDRVAHSPVVINSCNFVQVMEVFPRAFPR